jgi:hypothetical protein
MWDNGVVRSADQQERRDDFCIPLTMRRTNETGQLGPYILSRLGMALRDVTEGGGRAEQPPAMRRVLVELARLEARKQDQRPASIDC